MPIPKYTTPSLFLIILPPGLHNHEIKTRSPLCWIIMLLVFKLSVGYQWVLCRESEDFRGKRVETCPPLSSEGNKWKNPRESCLWTVLLPCASRTPRSTSVLIGSPPSRSHETQLLPPCFWSRLLTPFIVFSSGSDNSIKGFTGLNVHQIHKAPHGSTTETTQKSMKSFPEGFMKDLSSKTVFASVLHQCRERAACWQPLAPGSFYKIKLEEIFTESELWLSHFISNAQQTVRPQTALTFRRPCKVWCAN